MFVQMPVHIDTHLNRRRGGVGAAGRELHEHFVEDSACRTLLDFSFARARARRSSHTHARMKTYSASDRSKHSPTSNKHTGTDARADPRVTRTRSTQSGQAFRRRSHIETMVAVSYHRQWNVTAHRRTRALAFPSLPDLCTHDC